MAANNLLDGKKILVVDDEADVLDILVELLPMCDVVRATSFDEGKGLLESQDFDIAILDIMGVDGYTLLEIATKRNITAVMLTAHALTPDNLVRSIREGAACYIPKDQITNISDFLNDILKAQKGGENVWKPWYENLPSSYFEKRFGAAWKDADKEFWERFKASLRF